MRHSPSWPTRRADVAHVAIASEFACQPMSGRQMTPMRASYYRARQFRTAPPISHLYRVRLFEPAGIAAKLIDRPASSIRFPPPRKLPHASPLNCSPHRQAVTNTFATSMFSSAPISLVASIFAQFSRSSRFIARGVAHRQHAAQAGESQVSREERAPRALSSTTFHFAASPAQDGQQTLQRARAARPSRHAG